MTNAGVLLGIAAAISAVMATASIVLAAPVLRSFFSRLRRP